MRIGVADSFADPEASAAWRTLVSAAFPEQVVEYDPLTFSIAGHVGPDAFGMGISRLIAE